MIKKFLIIFILLFSLFFLALYAGFYFHVQKNSLRESVISVSAGEGFRQVGKKLEEGEIIRNATLFNLYAILSGDYKNIQAGTYILSPSMSISQIFKKFSSGDVARKRITIIEGWNISDIAECLEKEGLANKESFYSELNGWDEDNFYFLSDRPGGAGLEGYLFPDTYFMPLDAKEGDIIRVMLANFGSKISESMLLEIERRGKTVFEIVTMASLLEKEVRTSEDKKIVSGLLWKRIDAGMPLQVDATVAYITGKRTTKISVAETEIDSPYNTYKHKGLPVGPISNPGAESIEAAIYPEKSDYWFYLSKPDGETVFSRNHEEHVIAKSKYLK